MPLVLCRTRTRTQWNGTRTRREYWDVVDIQNRMPGFQLSKKAIELNRARRFEYEHEHEYREAEYEKDELSSTKTRASQDFGLAKNLVVF
jgi:hypothetical protein